MAQFFVRLNFIKLILTDFHNYFTVRIRIKLTVILSLKIPHLKFVAAIPCEISSVLKTTIENKANFSCNNTFKKN